MWLHRTQFLYKLEALYTNLQIIKIFAWPINHSFQITKGTLRAHNYLSEDGKRVPLSELERRSAYLEELEVLNEFNGFNNLKGLIIACLSNEPDERPSSGDLVHQLQALKKDDDVDTISSEVIERGLKILKEAKRNYPPFVSFVDCKLFTSNLR